MCASTGEILLPSQGMLLKKQPWKDSILLHHMIILLTPVFSSKILIPPKETVKKIFCLCSPFERAAATIPCRNKEQFGWFHYSSMCHSRAQTFACGQFTTFLRKLKDFLGTVASLTSGFLPFFKVPHIIQKAFQTCSHFQPLHQLILHETCFHVSWRSFLAHFSQLLVALFLLFIRKTKISSGKKLPTTLAYFMGTHTWNTQNQTTPLL